MLINALCEYYDVLAKNNKLIPVGYSEIDIDYLIALKEDGSIDEIIDWRMQETIIGKNGKEKVDVKPRPVQIMQRSEKTAIYSNIIEHRPLYIFGPNWTTKEQKDINKAVKSHNDFVKKNLDFIEGIDSPIVNAYRRFIESWNPKEQMNNELLINIGKNFATAKYAFCLSGQPEMLLHEDAKIRDKWNALIALEEDNDQGCKSQCCITGKYEEIARVHNKIKGFNAMGSALVNFNNPSDSSYGKSQSFNSNISESAMKKYTEAINYLISNKGHKNYLGDIAVIHWAASGDEECDDFMSMFVFDESDKMTSEEANNALNDFIKKTKSSYINQNTVNEIDKYLDDNTDYYIVGLKPNSSRLAVKFIYRQKVGKLVENIVKHQEDLRINGNEKLISINRINKELISPNTSNPTYLPGLVARLMESVVNGYMYPVYLLERVISRIKLDSDTDKNSFIKMNDVRVGIIKAYLNRRARLNNEKEEIKMYLDKENANQAYLCGRLFAVLERIQQLSAGGKLNRTIRDAYFSTAVTQPAVVFPKIMKLSQYHMSKLDNPIYFSKEIGEIVDRLNGEFPKMLGLVDQGKFIVGYYQQKNNYYITKKESEEK